MLTTNAFLSTSTSTRRRLGTRVPFAASRSRIAYRSSTRRQPELSLVPTTAPAPRAMVA